MAETEAQIHHQLTMPITITYHSTPLCAVENQLLISRGSPSLREDERMEADTGKATRVGPVKVGATNTIKEVKAAQAQTDDYGLNIL